MKTVNRGWLKKQIEQGNIEVISTYRFDDGFGTQTTEKVLPVRIDPGKGPKRKSGFCYIRDSELTSSSGGAYQKPNGSIILHTHSNRDYELRIIKDSTKVLPNVLNHQEVKCPKCKQIITALYEAIKIPNVYKVLCPTCRKPTLYNLIGGRNPNK